MQGPLLALMCWTQIAAAQTTPRPAAPAARSISAFERGIAAYNADDLEAAMDAFEEAVRIAPEQPEAHINLGLVYLRLQRPEDAMRELAQGAALARTGRHPGGRRIERSQKRPSRRNRCSD